MGGGTGVGTATDGGSPCTASALHLCRVIDTNAAHVGCRLPHFVSRGLPSAPSVAAPDSGHSTTSVQLLPNVRVSNITGFKPVMLGLAYQL